MYGFDHTGKMIPVQPPGVFTSKDPPGLTNEVTIVYHTPMWDRMVRPNNQNYWVSIIPYHDRLVYQYK